MPQVTDYWRQTLFISYIQFISVFTFPSIRLCMKPRHMVPCQVQILFHEEMWRIKLHWESFRLRLGFLLVPDIVSSTRRWQPHPFKMQPFLIPIVFSFNLSIYLPLPLVFLIQAIGSAIFFFHLTFLCMRKHFSIFA